MSRTSFILSIVLLASLTMPVRAVIVYQKNSDQPIRGTLVNENAVSIEVHERLPNGEIREHVLPRIVIEEIVRAVDNDRLGELHPDSPEDYRIYAEDLAAKTQDPEARDVAIRLYLIAAYLKPNELGRSCFLGMAGLAREPAEERAFRAMAFTLDPGHDASVLKAAKLKAEDYSGVTATERKALATAIQLLRTGKVKEAKGRLDRGPVQTAQEYYSYLVPIAEYSEALRTEGRLTTRQLRKFLTLEIVLSGMQVTDTTSDTTTATPWSQIIARDDTKPVTPQILTAITEFDPRDNLYRDGKWVSED